MECTESLRSNSGYLEIKFRVLTSVSCTLLLDWTTALEFTRYQLALAVMTEMGNATNFWLFQNVVRKGAFAPLEQMLHFSLIFQKS